MIELHLPYNWTPRPYQQKLWEYLCRGGKRAVVCAHRRWGKDDVCLHHTAMAMVERRANYGHMLPEYAQGRKVIWDAVNSKTGKRRIDEAFPLAMRAESGGTNNQEMKITTRPDGNGNVSTWQVLGSDNYNSLVGTGYAGIVKSEEALSDPAALAYLSPMLRENNGWQLAISTPRGHNHFERLLKTAQSTPSWYGELSPVTVTGVFTEAELQEELRQMQDLHGVAYGRALWLQEYYCSFDAAIPGAIWAESIDTMQLRGAVVEFAHDPATPVFLAYDLGRTDDTAIWFYQIQGSELDIIDYWAGNGCDINEPGSPERSLVHILLEKAETLQYRYARHWLPHDARPRRLGMGGKSILQQFQDAAKQHPTLGIFAIGPHLDVQEGIQAGRATFRQVRRFHATRCAAGLELLRQYHREWDPDKRMFLDHPHHDFSSHAADAWRYLSLTWQPSKILHPAPVSQPISTRPWTWADATKYHFETRRRLREWQA